jgi:hypothetical protein
VIWELGSGYFGARTHDGGFDRGEFREFGADYTNAARAMMMAVGCIQSQRCHTNTCPVGVATQDPKRARALDVPDKTERVRSYAELYHWLEPGELLAEPPEPWVADWARANPDSFAIA